MLAVITQQEKMHTLHMHKDITTEHVQSMHCGGFLLNNLKFHD